MMGHQQPPYQKLPHPRRHPRRVYHRGVSVVPKMRCKMSHWKRFVGPPYVNNNINNKSEGVTMQPTLLSSPPHHHHRHHHHLYDYPRPSYPTRNSNSSSGSASKRPTGWWDNGCYTHFSIKPRCNNKYDPITGYRKLPSLDDRMWGRVRC